MKRGFEENVPKVRPRVRLGRALDEQFAEAQEVAALESAAPPIAPVMPETDVVPEQIKPAPPPPRRKSAAVTEVAGLVRVLTEELRRAEDVNAKLQTDLGAAHAGLQAEADE